MHVIRGSVCALTVSALMDWASVPTFGEINRVAGDKVGGRLLFRLCILEQFLYFVPQIYIMYLKNEGRKLGGRTDR